MREEKRAHAGVYDAANKQQYKPKISTKLIIFNMFNCIFSLVFVLAQ